MKSRLTRLSVVALLTAEAVVVPLAIITEIRS